MSSTVYRAPDDLSARLDRSIYDMAQLPTLPALTADVLRSVTIAASGAECTFTVDGGVWTEGGADVSAETASLADVRSPAGVLRLRRLPPRQRRRRHLRP